MAGIFGRGAEGGGLLRVDVTDLEDPVRMALFVGRTTARPVLHHGSPAALHFIGGNFFDFMLDHPLVAERITDRRATKTVEHVTRRHLHRRTGGTRAGRGRVGVLDHQAEFHSGAIKGLRRLVAPSEILVGKHEVAAVEDDFRVSNLAGSRVGEPVKLRRSEGALIKLDGLARVPHRQVGTHRRVVVG